MKQLKAIVIQAFVLIGLTFTAHATTNPEIDRLIAAEQAMFKGLQDYLGMTNVNNMEAQNILMFTLPPSLDVTKTVGTRMIPAESSMTSWQETQLRNLAMYNAYTPEKTLEAYLQKRLSFCGRNESNEDIWHCDYTKPNSGDDELAFNFIDKLGYPNEAARSAALEYIRNVTVPAPFDYPTDLGKIFSSGDPKKGLTEEGQKYFKMVYSSMAALTMAQNSLLAIFLDRDRIANFGTGLSVNGVAVGNPETGAASMLEMLNYEATRRYGNAAWYDAMTKISDAAVTREMANIQAAQYYLNVKSYEQMSRIEGLLATQIGMLAALNGQLAQAESATENVNTEELMKGVTGEGQ